MLDIAFIKENYNSVSVAVQHFLDLLGPPNYSSEARFTPVVVDVEISPTVSGKQQVRVKDYDIGIDYSNEKKLKIYSVGLNSNQEVNMPYKFDKKNLYYNDRKIYEAPTDITEMFNYIADDKVFIIYRGRNLLPDDYHDIMNPNLKDPKLQEAINQNVLCIDKEGNIIWRIEPTISIPIDHVRFTKNGPNYDDVWVYRRDAREFKIDPQNGKILDWRMGL